MNTMGFKKNDYIWTDRRRRMGMPLSFTRYAMNEDRLFLSGRAEGHLIAVS